LKHQILNIDKSLIRINPEDISYLLGDGESGSALHTNGLTEQLIAKCYQIMNPGGGYLFSDAIPTEVKEEIAIEKHRFKTGKIIRNMFRGAEQYVLFIATAGPGPEELSRTLLNEGNYLEGYLVDLIGSVLVELVADQVQDNIKEMADSMGVHITNRYSPGHCSWDVDDQQKLFNLFPQGFCGITLSDSSLMSPIKSVSGVIGMGSSVSYRENTCEICSMKECIFRTPRP
jgi:hypothetical protein